MCPRLVRLDVLGRDDAEQGHSICWWCRKITQRQREGHPHCLCVSSRLNLGYDWPWRKFPCRLIAIWFQIHQLSSKSNWDSILSLIGNFGNSGSTVLVVRVRRGLLFCFVPDRALNSAKSKKNSVIAPTIVLLIWRESINREIEFEDLPFSWCQSSLLRSTVYVGGRLNCADIMYLNLIPLVHRPDIFSAPPNSQNLIYTRGKRGKDRHRGFARLWNTSQIQHVL